MDGEEGDSSAAIDAIDGFVIDNDGDGDGDGDDEVGQGGGGSDGKGGAESPPASDAVDAVPTRTVTDGERDDVDDDANDASLLNLTGLNISEITEATDLNLTGGTPWKENRDRPAASATSFLNLSEVSEATTATNTTTPDTDAIAASTQAQTPTPSKLVEPRANGDGKNGGDDDYDDLLATLSDASTRGSSLTPSERRFAASSADDGDGEVEMDGEGTERRQNQVGGQGTVAPPGDGDGAEGDDRPTPTEERGADEGEDDPFAGLSGPDGVPMPSWEDPAVAAIASSSMRAHDPRSESMQVEISSDPDVDQLSAVASSPVVPSPEEEPEVEIFQDAVTGSFDGDDGDDEVDANVDVDVDGGRNHNQPPVLSWADGTGMLNPVDGDGCGRAVGGGRTIDCSESMLVEVASEPDHDRLSSAAGGSSVGGDDLGHRDGGERDDDDEPSETAATEAVAEDGMTPPSQSPATDDGEGTGDGTNKGVADSTNDDDADDDDFGDFGDFTAPSAEGVGEEPVDGGGGSTPQQPPGDSADADAVGELDKSWGGEELGGGGDPATASKGKGGEGDKPSVDAEQEHDTVPSSQRGDSDGRDDFGDFGSFNDAAAAAPPQSASGEGDGTGGQQDDFGDFGSFEDAGAADPTTGESSSGDPAGKDEPQPSQSKPHAADGADDEDDDDFGDFGTFSDDPPPSASTPSGITAEETGPSPNATAGSETTPQTPAADDEEEDFGDFGDFGTFEEAQEGPKDATEASSAREDAAGPEKSTTRDDGDDDDFGDFGSFSDAPPPAPPSSFPPAQKSALGNEGTVPSGVAEPGKQPGGLTDQALIEEAKRVFEAIFSPMLPPVSPEEMEQSFASREFGPVSVQDVLSSLSPTVEGEDEEGTAPWSQSALIEYLAEVRDLPDTPASVIVSDNTSRHVSSPPPLLSQVDLSVLEKPAAASSNERSAASKTAGVDGNGKDRVSSSERRRAPEAGDEKVVDEVGKPDSELNNGNKATIKTAQEFLDNVPDMSFMLESKLSLPPGLDDPSKAFDL